MNPRINIPLLNKISIVLFVAFLIFGVYRLMSSGSRVEHNGDPIDLRNSNIISLRMPDSIALSQRIAIYEEGYATRFFVPRNVTNSNKTEILLDPNEMKGLETLRKQWCESNLFPDDLVHQEQYYDVAMYCVGKGIKQAKVPVSLLPQVLAEILRRLPPLPTPTP